MIANIVLKYIDIPMDIDAALFWANLLISFNLNI